jgi:hypothetical protein
MGLPMEVTDNLELAKLQEETSPQSQEIATLQEMTRPSEREFAVSEDGIIVKKPLKTLGSMYTVCPLALCHLILRYRHGVSKHEETTANRKDAEAEVE